MSNNNEEEFKVSINNKIYLINISILQEQLSLVLTLLGHSPKQYSGFFSLEELRISSRIFQHTNSLFEAKELIKRTVIKKQLSISEDEHKAKITFDTGLGIDSIPFPIVLFRDLNVNHLTKSQTLEELKILIDNKNKLMNANQLKNNENMLNNKNNQNNQNNQQQIFLRPSIGNNINNKMLNNNFNNNKLSQSIIINTVNGNFNNIQPLKVNNNKLNNTNINNLNKNCLPYKQVDLTQINKMNKNNNTKDFININNQILYNMYNNMNQNNNINSNFYKNLENSFISFKNNKPENIQNNNNINTNNKIQNNNIINKNQNININNNQNNNINQALLQQNLNLMKNNDVQSDKNKNIIIFNPNRSMIPQYNLVQNIELKRYFNERNLRGRYISPNQSSKTSPIDNNRNRISNFQNNILNKMSPKEQPKDNEKFKNNSENKESEEEEENNDEANADMDEKIDEGNLDQKNYRFKNLELKGTRKVKGNLEKFKQSQNMGDYTPSGTKFVSYLKFPDTKSNFSSNYTSTLSSSITSSSNRIPGIEKNVVNNPGEMDEITSRIKRILNKRNIRFKIIYRGTEHGDLSTIFHEKCDNIKNTLVLVHTSCNKRFGGFTTQTWDGEDINKKDDNCFIFSIDKMRVYDIIKGQNAINCNPDYGPVFINQIKLLDKFFTQGGTTDYKGKTFQTLENFEITGGAEKFGIKEVEVYQVY